MQRSAKRCAAFRGPYALAAVGPGSAEQRCTASGTRSSDHAGSQLRPPMQRALLQQRIPDISRLFLLQPFAFSECHTVRSMRGPCGLQAAAGVVALAQREPYPVLDLFGDWAIVPPMPPTSPGSGRRKSPRWSFAPCRRRSLPFGLTSRDGLTEVFRVARGDNRPPGHANITRVIISRSALRPLQQQADSRSRKLE